MKAEIEHKNERFTVDLDQPIDISIPLRAGDKNVNAWYVDPVSMEPVMTELFTGDVNLGGSVNFRNIRFNPHGNGTHTECVGHISKEAYTINRALQTFFFLAEVITVTPPEDGAISSEQLAEKVNHGTEALIIRTTPNGEEKRNMHYSNTNPPFIAPKAMEWIVAKGYDHVLIDLPSVDPEFDEGQLKSHHIFWNYPNDPQTHRTISELIYVPNEVPDGRYLMNLQIASFENDASPSKPVLFRILS